MAPMRSPSRFAGAERPARFRPDRFTLFLAALALLGAGLALAREAAWGVSLSWDSVQYIAAARNLLGDTPLEFTQMGGEHRDENTYRFWPPFYPMLLAAGGLGVADPLDVAGPLNAIAFGLTVFVAGTWLRRNVRSRFLLVWGCLALALAPPLTGVASWAMSEAPFVLFATLALTRADAFLREGGRPLLVQAAAFTAIACLTRYMGVAVLGTVVLLVLLQRGPAPAERLRAAAIYALLSLAPLALWLARNVLVLGAPTDNDLPVDYALPEILLDLLIAVGKWAVPLDASWWGRAAAALLAVALAVGVAQARNGWALAAMRPNPVFGWFALLFVILHVVAMLSGNTWHGVDERHLLPIYVPLLLVTLSALDQALARRETGTGYPLIPAGGSMREYGSAALLALAVSLWVVSGAMANLKDIRDGNASPGSPENYASGYWRDSGIMEHIVPDPEYGIYSNYPAALYVQRPGFREYGELKGQIATGYEDNLRRFIAEIANEGDWIVWFHAPVHARFDYDAGDLRAHPGLRLVAEAESGALFRIRERAAVP